MAKKCISTDLRVGEHGFGVGEAQKIIWQVKLIFFGTPRRLAIRIFAVAAVVVIAVEQLGKVVRSKRSVLRRCAICACFLKSRVEKKMS